MLYIMVNKVICDSVRDMEHHEHLYIIHISASENRILWEFFSLLIISRYTKHHYLSMMCQAFQINSHVHSYSCPPNNLCTYV